MTIDPVPGFEPGCQVWPTPDGPFDLQRCPQVVVASVDHPRFGPWIYTIHDEGGPNCYCARYWTTEEPGPAEREARAIRVREREAENEQIVKDRPWMSWPVV